ncbi:MAG: MMPL family transporter [Planctomycetes bacterium]|nr:MMPL family transporter [Planctomycetota bacterium]
MLGQSYLRGLASLVVRHPVSALVSALALALVSVLYSLARLELETSRNDLVSRHQRYVQLADDYEAEFKGLDEFIVVIGSPSPRVSRDFADRLGRELQSSPRAQRLIAEVFYRVDPGLFDGKKLLLLQPDELQRIRTGLTEHRELVEHLVESPSLNRVFAWVNREMKQELARTGADFLLGASDESPRDEGKDIRQLAFFSSLARQMEASLHPGEHPPYQSPWSEFFGGGQIEEDGYLTTADKKYLLMQVRHIPGDGFLKHGDALAFIRSSLAKLKMEFPAVEAGVTGTPALGSDEMTAAMRDMQWAGIIAFAGVTLLYLAAFREIRRPILVVLCLLVGMGWSTGFLTLTVGHLSILTVAFVSILTGLGIDYGFHLLIRYEEERYKGFAIREALDIALTQTLPGIFAGALTTALTFFAVMLVDFRGMQELGWISGSGVLLTFFATLVCLPPLLILTEKRTDGCYRWKQNGRDSWLARLVNRRPGLILSSGIVLSLLAIPGFRSLSFDYNLLNLQSRSTESVRWERRILESSRESSWFAFASANSLEEVERKVKRFQKLPSVRQVRSILDLLPADQAARAQGVRAIQEAVAGLDGSGPHPPPAPPDVPRLKEILEKCKFTLRKKDDNDGGPWAEALGSARKDLLVLIDRLKDTPENEAGVRLAAFQSALFSDFSDKLSLLRRNASPAAITLDEIPPVIRDRFVSARGHYLIHVYCSKDVWQRDAMKEFVEQLRSVDPDVTGPPVIGSESIGLMKRGYVQGGIYSLIVIVLIIFVMFRRLLDTFLVLLPVLLGAVWTIGLMWLCNLQFNLANLVVIPLIIGIGIDGGIHIVHRVREERTVQELLRRSTPRAVVLSFLSTIIGFGSLLVADHYGIFSLGLLLTLAVTSALVVTLTVLPAILFFVIPRSKA